MKKKPRLKGTELLKLAKKRLNYDPETGVFTWKRGHKQIRKGSRAGSPTKDGYRAIKLNGHLYFEHRLAHLWVNEYETEYFIDHKNGNRQDNRSKNLREVTPRCNTQNTAKTKRKTTSKYKGVSRLPDGRWRAYIEVAGKRKSLGRFDTEFEAACARLKAEQKDPDWHCDLQDHNTKTILKEIL
jgi:hypothetical protein